MISGIFLAAPENSKSAHRFQECNTLFRAETIFSDERILFTNHRDQQCMGDHSVQLFKNEQLAVVATGTPIADQPVQSRETPDSAACELLAQTYQRAQERGFAELRGGFAGALYDLRAHELVLVRDHFGIESLYYCEEEGLLFFASSIRGVVRLRGKSSELYQPGLGKVLLFNYNTGLQTCIAGIRRLPAAHFLKSSPSQSGAPSRYWKLRFQVESRSEGQLAEELLAQLRGSVGDFLGNSKHAGIFLSGGMDSSTMLGLSAESKSLELSTFSYRCRSASFDESHYARIMADFAKSKHHECEYSSDDILLMPEVVGAMNEPFCDVGINIATYLLGREASGAGCDTILTGDGGDELFAGHPVYEADKIGRIADALPRPLLGPLLALFRMLPDSDQKKNLVVKLKRFSESLSFPKELLSHRWRIYYDSKELSTILGSGLGEGLNWQELLEDIFAINSENSGPDMLSECLYSDYQTVVDFYLRRNDLVRRFGIKTQYPMLDPRLVEFCAAMPNDMKIHGWFNTKYLFKKAMEPVLPHDIIYRKDKLGHSIPLKNWIRQDQKVRELILDHVSGEQARLRRLFNPQTIDTLVNDHLRKKRNNSHRLWTLAVIEMWLRHNLDG